MATSDTARRPLNERLDGDRSVDARGQESRIGIDHLTVVPENFDPETDTVDQ
ncbi:hypothetical protein [Natranaeroarchaeum sulfidigenes]|uniref:Uncharacterized protein n=1 Tax=Natranaeroarchaeum sulfidigenes TaxID=2784880 RepID=A0A897MNK8_9EURY|nr:hypothetical protein [Natranaeroarchaeum sulfidigenes]QSG03760.1 hypothetical protein AArcS_2564 [Natranaeroarchaeum sulfidigenes]